MNEQALELHQDVAVLKRDMEKLMGNGQPGIIAEIRQTLKDLSESHAKFKTTVIVLLVGLIAANLLTGSGTVSLESLLKLLK